MILSIGGKTSEIDIEDLLRAGKHFSLSRQRSLHLLKESIQGVTKAVKSNQNMLQLLSATHPLCRSLLNTIWDNINKFKNQQEAEGI